MLRPLLLFILALLSPAAEPLAVLQRNGVIVQVELVSRNGSEAELRILYTPQAAVPPLHLYSTDLTGTVGVATRASLETGSTARQRGPLRVDQTTHLLEDLPVYPEGPVTLHLPITLPMTTDGAAVETTLLVSYMACSTATCLVPVVNAPMRLPLPSVIQTNAGPASIDLGVLQTTITAALAQEREHTQQTIQTAISTTLEHERERSATVIQWRHVATVSDVESLIAEARATHRAALLDFTGPSCVNCQQMAKTVLRLPDIAAAWNSGIPIHINTDPPYDALAAWQQQRFQTQARPLYVRIGTDGTETRWSEVFSLQDTSAHDRFIRFLNGGDGSDAGTGQDLWRFLLLAIAGGLFTLVMPCTYPMIPFTVNFFAKQAAAGHRLLPLAAFYALGIIGCFVGLGVLITGILGASLSTLAGHPVTNLLIAVLFIAFGLSLLGAWFLRLPPVLENALGGGRAGYLGALLMGLTFAVTAFTCTAPFAGTILAEAVATGAWSRPIIGMAVYASAIAVPFFFLAISPGALKSLPRAGAWMNEVKIIGGIVELAAALKFLAICDAAWGWGIIGRDFTLASWTACAVVISLYTFGFIRTPSDERLENIGPMRLLIAVMFLALSVWLAAGLTGHNVGILESFFPADSAPV